MQRRTIGTAALGVVGCIVFSARADVLTDLPDKILSQCGLVSALLVVAVVYLSVQLAKTRAGWEADRGEWYKALSAQNTSHENLAISNAKLEGILLTLQRH